MDVPRAFYKSRMNELVRHIASEAYDGIVFLTFVRGQKQITIQFERKEFPSSDVMVMIQEISHFNGIDWSDRGENWCYMTRSKKTKALQFTQRHKEVDRYKVKEQPWASQIHEWDIKCDEYGPGDFRYGQWKGREVDVYKLWMDRDMEFLSRAMKSYRRLQGTGLTYGILGHVFDDDGNIVGIMTEPMEGRRLELHDKALVFESLRRLNKMGLILDSPLAGSMLVTNRGELRITDMHNVIELPQDRKDREWKIRDREEVCDECVFKGLKNACPSWRTVPLTRGQLCTSVLVLLPHPTPEKILKGSNEWGWWRFKDRLVTSQVEIFGVVRKKRPLEVGDAEDDDGTRPRDESWRRPTKRPRNFVRNRRQLPRSLITRRHEPLLPRLPVHDEDLPLMPPSLHDISENVLRFPSPSSSCTSDNTGDISDWLRDSGLLELAMTSRFKFIKS